MQRHVPAGAFRECPEPKGTGDRVSLAHHPLEELLTALENDAISAGEVNWMKRRLRHGSV